MDEKLHLNPDHNRYYYVVNNNLADKYIRLSYHELGYHYYEPPNNISNKIKKRLGFVLMFKEISNETVKYNYEYRIEIHNQQKLFLFRLKYGL